MEIWLRVAGFENRYQVSSFGRVRFLGCDYVDQWGHQRQVSGRILKLRANKAGYIYVKLRHKAQKQVCVLVHRLVALAFLDEDPGRPFVNHKDGIKANNSPSNLEWVTYSENVQHALRTGLLPSGERAQPAKLSDKQVEEIRSAVATGEKQAFVAARYGISKGYIWKIVNGWKRKHQAIA